MHVVAQCGPSLLQLQGLFIDTVVTRLLSHVFSFILHPLVRHNETFWAGPKLQVAEAAEEQAPGFLLPSD